MFDAFSDKYELMITFPQRIERERPFFKTIFDKFHVSRVLDAGCGTGNHAIEFSKWGLDVVGCDISLQMIERAKLNARTEQASVEFKVAAFQELTKKLSGNFDAIVCIGNNLPLVLDEADLRLTLQNMHQILSEDGVCIVQNQNYDRILKKQHRFLPLKVAMQEDKEFLFFRMLDLHEDPLKFHIVTFLREKGGAWTYSVQSSKLRPWRKSQLETTLFEVGFQKLEFFGSYTFSQYEAATSTDLIIIAYA